jgi:hypothetical protein
VLFAYGIQYHPQRAQKREEAITPAIISVGNADQPRAKKLHLNGMNSAAAKNDQHQSDNTKNGSGGSP